MLILPVHLLIILEKLSFISLPDPCGEFSISTIITLSTSLFNRLPRFISKELYILTSSPSSFDTEAPNFSNLKNLEIRVSIVSQAGEVFSFKQISSSTGGVFSVPRNEDEIFNTIIAQIESSRSHSVNSSKAIELIDVAFPKGTHNHIQIPCIWYPDYFNF